MPEKQEDRRCDFFWRNNYGELLRCMFDKGHPLSAGHKHGFQRCWDPQGEERYD